MIIQLCDMQDGQSGDLFALLTSKEELKTREGKPYFRVAFRDGGREVSFPIWGDSPLAVDCKENWTPGSFYKLRAAYRETNFGPQLDIDRIREVTDDDQADGFDPGMCQARSRFEPQSMYDELLALVQEHVENLPLRKLVETIFEENRERLLTSPAARGNHHAYLSGLLEHTLSVTRTCVFLADKYTAYYPDLNPPLDKSLVVAGAVLHDIGKLRELESTPVGTHYTASGELIGHILQGRDIVREVAAQIDDLDPETQLRLEHLILAHQRLPEWGSPKPPMTPEALLVHYADDIDAKYQMMVKVLTNDTTTGPVTSRKNVLYQKLFKGLGEKN